MVSVSTLSLLVFTHTWIAYAKIWPWELINEDGYGVPYNPSVNVLLAASGKCPSYPDTECPFNQVCCPDTCCEPDFPRCTVHGFCVREDGKSACYNSDVGWTTGVICRAYEGEVRICCTNPPFEYCTADLPYRCVNKDGFTACGDENKPGVSCGGGKCCSNPRTCCRTGCCDGPNLNASRSIEPRYSSFPGESPIPMASSEPMETTTPEPTSDPQPSVDSSTISPPIPSSDNREDEEPTCFPANATVEMEDGQVKTMRDLQTGDRVRVSSKEFSEVFMWTHRDHKFEGASFIKLIASEGHALVASIGHVVYVCKGVSGSCAKEAAPIEDIEIGDRIWILKHGLVAAVNVLEKWKVSGEGLYNPHTYHGDIVVNDVLSSCYTRAVPMSAAHGALSPMRALHSAFPRILGIRTGSSSGADGTSLRNAWRLMKLYILQWQGLCSGNIAFAY